MKVVTEVNARTERGGLYRSVYFIYQCDAKKNDACLLMKACMMWSIGSNMHADCAVVVHTENDLE